MTDIQRIVVAMTGASGAVYGRRILEILASRADVESHLVASTAAMATVNQELGISPAQLRDMADVVHKPSDIGASIASGSFETAGMVVAPCSIKTLSAIAHCYSSDLISRAADVTLKERRPLVLMIRETPLHLGHLRAMLAAAEMGAVIAPPLPAFYQRPRSLEDVVDHSVRRVLVQLGLKDVAVPPWEGLQTSITE